jgi:hypothetical protein
MFEDSLISFFLTFIYMLVSTGWKNFFRYFDFGGAPFAKLSYLL